MFKHKEYIHIDNGGITLSLEDMGAKGGIIFSIHTSYHGYPSAETILRIDDNVCDLLESLRRLIKSAEADVNSIDWEARHE